MSRWVEIPGCRFRYRINEEGQVQRQLENGIWRDIKTSLLRGSSRATVNLTLANGKRRQSWRVWRSTSDDVNQSAADE